MTMREIKLMYDAKHRDTWCRHFNLINIQRTSDKQPFLEYDKFFKTAKPKVKETPIEFVKEIWVAAMKAKQGDQ